MSIHINMGSVTHNVVTPVNVVASAYDTSGNGGRKLVRLSNGWVVAAVERLDSPLGGANNTVEFRVNRLDGNGFSRLTYAAVADRDLDFSIAAVGTKVTCLICDTLAVYSVTFDALTVSDSEIFGTSYKVVDGSQTAVDTGSIAAHTDGTLHAAWASKNATYPNTFNIRYSKSTDGGTTWAAVAQITAGTGASDYYDQPCIVVRTDGNPQIFFRLRDSTNGYVYSSRYNGSAWVQLAVVTTTNTYVPQNPCATVAPDGSIHVSWHGKDATDSAKFNIRYSKSTDGGATWSAAIKLTTGNTYDQLSPSVACRTDGRIYVMWHGQHAGSTTYTQIRQRYYGLPDIGGGGIDWQGISNLTSASAHQTNVQTCETVNTFQDYPLHIWADAGGSVKFRGAWTVSGVKTVTQASVNVGGLWKPATVYINTGASGDVTPIPSGAVFGLHFDGNTTDFIGSLVPESNTGTFDTVNKKFGTASMAYNGSQFTQYAPPSFFSSILAQDWWVGMWIRRASTGVSNYLFAQSNSSATGASTSIGASFAGSGNNQIQCFANIGGTARAILTGQVTDTGQHYLKFGRAGGLFICSIDGVIGGSTAVSGNFLNGTNKFCFGRFGEYTVTPFVGNLDEFMFVVGQPMNTTNFTPPQYPYGQGPWKQV